MPNLSKTAFLLILLSFFYGYNVSGQNSRQNILKEFEKLNKAGEKALLAGDYPKALEYFNKAELIAESNEQQDIEVIAKFNIARVYGDIHSLGDALKYYHDALDIARKNSELEVKSLTIMVNIGNLYIDEGDMQMALEYYQRTFEKAKKINSIYNIGLSAINISDVYNKLGNYNLSRKYLDEVKNLEMGNIAQQTWKINYAESYFGEGRLEEA